ncbi:flagellar hook assembly protein FlgD [Phenylobacterium sp.]|jgi:flagellar basal-body rod modification protein FlgD|uniref:flagellar hook assembly protein FlgD n=1 Tax=Phenylobacterium sp. TaxID=1871053 RepID=UPI002E37E7D8|nr:flagellar hook assembly protein FlgD [Phenylobacterium sp.]HEX2561059.1 flagellar hook assembly protein FlgD [Phenylobacterium sp.]
MAVDAVTATQAPPQETALGKARLAQNFETFLTLLTTQLKNQDPLSPLDSNQFTEQLTQMTGVEQQLLTNELLEKLVAGNNSGVADAVSLIGKKVRAVSDDVAMKDGKASWIYNLDRTAANVKLEVLDDKGRVVFVGSPSKNGEGDHAFTWDGKNSAGVKQPDGVYTLRVTAIDSAKKLIDSVTFIEGVVNSVEQKDGKTLISVGGAKMEWTAVSTITLADPPATTSTSQTSQTSDTGDESEEADNNNWLEDAIAQEDGEPSPEPTGA